jgi:hypothetical protein
VAAFGGNTTAGGCGSGNTTGSGGDAADIGAASETAINSATSEATETVTISGTLIEIGNTTAEETTVVIRIVKNGKTEDITLEVPTKSIVLTNAAGAKADLSDWVAGDQITVTAQKHKNSGRMIAQKMKNDSFKAGHKGVNGWIKAIRTDKNEIDVEWGKNIYTLNLAEAKMVAGVKNPAVVADLKVGDRVRCRVMDDGDKNPATWKAKIVVVLRRGNDLFMRVTRAVVSAKITSIPTDLSLPTTIEAEILPSKAFQKGDVNNLIGEPGTKIYINISTSTDLVRRFLGKSLLSEYSVGDSIMVVGRRNETSGNIDAKMIKNDSTQVLGVAARLGVVTAVDPSNGTIAIKMLPSKKGEETVTVKITSATKIFRDGKEATINEIIIGDTLKTKGVYNRDARAVDAKVVGVTSKTKNQVIKEKVQNLRDRIQDLLKKGVK